MKKIINKIMFRLGFVPYDKLAETLKELALESRRRGGKPINYIYSFGDRLEVSMKGFD